MEELKIGDLVVLTAGSMRMAVETVEDETISCVWCHEGRIGRDAFNVKLLKKWEHREDDRSGKGSGKPYRGDRDGGGKPHGPHGEGREDRPRGKPGWDGKPREKKYFRKDG